MNVLYIEKNKQYVCNIVVPTIISEYKVEAPLWRISTNGSNDRRLDSKSSEMACLKWNELFKINIFLPKTQSFKCSLPPSEKQFQV